MVRLGSHLKLGTSFMSEDPPPNFEFFPTETWDFFDFLTTPPLFGLIPKFGCFFYWKASLTVHSYFLSFIKTVVLCLVSVVLYCSQGHFSLVTAVNIPGIKGSGTLLLGLSYTLDYNYILSPYQPLKLLW